MAIIKALKAGNWSDTTVWSGGALPVAGESVDLDGYVVAMNVARIPATGTLALLGSPAKAGQITVALATVGNCEINATTITAGTVGSGGFIAVTGTTTNTLTINGSITGGSSRCLVHNSSGNIVIVGNITGGIASNSFGIYNASPGAITITGTVTGGSATGCYGLYNYSTGTITIMGSVTGGSGTNAYGLANAATGTVTITGTVTGGSIASVYGVSIAATSAGAVTITGNVVGGSGTGAAGISNLGTAVVTLNTCNLINSAGSVAYSGCPPTWNLNTNNYLQWGSTKFPQQLLDHQVLAGVVHGDITGNRVDCPVAKALTTSGNYGDPDAPLVGTYVAVSYPIIGGSHIIKPARAA